MLQELVISSPELATFLLNLRHVEGISKLFSGSSDILTELVTYDKNKLKKSRDSIKSNVVQYKSIKSHMKLHTCH